MEPGTRAHVNGGKGDDSCGGGVTRGDRCKCGVDHSPFGGELQQRGPVLLFAPHEAEPRLRGQIGQGARVPLPPVEIGQHAQVQLAHPVPTTLPALVAVLGDQHSTSDPGRLRAASQDLDGRVVVPVVQHPAQQVGVSVDGQRFEEVALDGVGPVALAGEAFRAAGVADRAGQIHHGPAQPRRAPQQRPHQSAVATAHVHQVLQGVPVVQSDQGPGQVGHPGGHQLVEGTGQRGVVGQIGPERRTVEPQRVGALSAAQGLGQVGQAQVGPPVRAVGGEPTEPGVRVVGPERRAHLGEGEPVAVPREQALTDQVPQHPGQPLGVDPHRGAEFGGGTRPVLQMVGDPQRRDRADRHRRDRAGQCPETVGRLSRVDLTGPGARVRSVHRAPCAGSSTVVSDDALPRNPPSEYKGPRPIADVAPGASRSETARGPRACGRFPCRQRLPAVGDRCRRMPTRFDVVGVTLASCTAHCTWPSR
jgi:hypothetical protein